MPFEATYMRVDLVTNNEVHFFSYKRLICGEMKKEKPFTQGWGFPPLRCLQRVAILMESSYANKSSEIIVMSLPMQRSFTMGTKESGIIFRNVNLIVEWSGIISSGRLRNSFITQFLYVSQAGVWFDEMGKVMKVAEIQVCLENKWGFFFACAQALFWMKNDLFQLN